MTETVIAQILFQSALPDIATGQAMLYIGLFGAVTLIVMKLNSALGLLAWALTGVMLVFSLLGVVSEFVYFMMLAMTMLALAATAMYAARNA